MKYQIQKFTKITLNHLSLEYYFITDSIPKIIGFIVRECYNADDLYTVLMLMQIVEWDKVSPMMVDRDDTVYIITPIDESIQHQNTKIFRIRIGTNTNELEFRFESNMFVRIHRDGNKVQISIVQDANVLMTVYDRSGNPEYTDGDGNLNLLFCLTKAQSVMQSYLELQGETK